MYTHTVSQTNVLMYIYLASIVMTQSYIISHSFKQLQSHRLHLIQLKQMQDSLVKENSLVHKPYSHSYSPVHHLWNNVELVNYRLTYTQLGHIKTRYPKYLERGMSELLILQRGRKILKTGSAAKGLICIQNIQLHINS